METHRNQNFQGKSFVVEEVAFINCKLTDCDLYYSGGDFDWMNSNFDNCRFHWRGEEYVSTVPSDGDIESTGSSTNSTNCGTETQLACFFHSHSCGLE